MQLSAQEFAEWLDCIVPPHNGDVVALKVGFDESGTHGGTHFTLAAVAGKAIHWQQVERDWAATAATYPKGYYATSARDEDNAKLAAIMDRWLYGYAFSISYADFAIVTNDIKSEFGSIYVHALRGLSYFLKVNAEARAEFTLAYVLESGHKEESSAQQYLSSLIVNRPEFRVYSHVWVGKDALVTHPADLAAHVACSTYTKRPSPLVDLVQKSVQFIEFPRDLLAENVQGGYEALRDNRQMREHVRNERRKAREDGETAC